MTSITTCIKKAGKALSRDDADAIKEIYQDLVNANQPNAAQLAVDEYLTSLDGERAGYVQQIEEQGGVVRSGLRYARGRPELRAAEKLSIVSILDGDERLTIPGTKTTKAGKPRATMQGLAQALVDRALKVNRGRRLTARTARSKEIISEVLAQETIAAMDRSGHAGDWYDGVITRAVKVMSLVHPEIGTDSEARSVFMLGLAITSNGNDVTKNAQMAEVAYAGYKKNGEFPTTIGVGITAGAVNEGLARANEMLKTYGLANFTKFLNTEFTVGELAELGFEVSSEGVNYKTHGSAVFGPKVGAGFYQNLMGNFQPLTMDRWFMRTWGRITGTLLPDKNALPATQAERFTEQVEKNPADVEALGYNVQEVLADDALLVELAAKVRKRYERDLTQKTRFHMTAKNLDIKWREPIIDPGTGENRNWIREVASTTIEKLQQRGYPISSASFQALIWYPEKELALMHGVGNAKANPTDYEQEFAKLAAAKGVDEQRIADARVGDQVESGPGAARVSGEAAVEGEARVGLAKQERARLLHKAVTARIREQLPRPYRATVPRGAQRTVDGVKTIGLFKPMVQVKNAYEKVGLSAPEIAELEAGANAAEVFAARIRAAKESSPNGAAVYVYPEEEYADMRLFLTPDGMAGFALNGDDIISAFKNPMSDMPGVAQAVLGLAVSEGGRRLDAFDTALPTMYSLQGFRVVSRLPWDDSQAPPDWDKKQFAGFNNGEPDVVFMVYDKSRADAYAGQYEGQYAEDYDSAVDMQSFAVAELAERNKPRSVLYSLPKATEDRINRDPTGPLSRLHKLGATMEDQANAGIVNVAYNQISEMWNNGRIKFLLASVPRRNLGDFLPDNAAPSVKRYVRMANRMSGRRNELLAETETIARDWAKWARKEKRMAGRLGDLMHAATIAGVDPSIEYKPLMKRDNMDEDDKIQDTLRREQYVMLQGYYENLDETGKKVFKQVRDHYIKQRGDLEQALINRIEDSIADAKTKQALADELRRKFEGGRVAGPYFPLMRYGDLWAVAKDKDDTVVSYARFENRAEQKEWLKEWKGQQGITTDQGRRSDSVGDFVQQVDPKFASRVVQLVKDTGDSALADEVWQLYIRSLPEMSMRKRFLHRKGRMGFAVDALRGFAHVSFRNAHQQSKLEYMHKMQNQISSLYEEVRAIESNPELSKEFNWAMPVHDEFVRRHELAQAPNVSPIAVNITGAGFLWFLGFTPAAAAVNLTQTALVGMPVLSGEFNVMGANKELLRASGQAAGAWRGGLKSRLRGDDLRAFNEAERIGTFDKTQAHDLAGVTEAGATAYGGAMHRTMELGSLLFHGAEQFNRHVTFLAGYRLARQRGDTHDDAVLLAEDLTWDAHFNYDTDNRPRWMQGNVARVLTLFKQYSLNMTYRMFRDAHNAITNLDISKAEKKKARVRFTGMMMMAGLMAGYTGLPAILTETIRHVAETIFGDEDDKFNAEDAMRAYLADMFGSKFAEAFMKGPVDAFLGLTLSNRVSLGQLWWRDPNPTEDEEKAFLHTMMEVLGPVVSTAKEVVIDAPRLFSEGHTDRGIEKMTPKFLRDILRSYRFSTEGALTLHSPPDVLMPAEDFSPVDLFWQTFGFSPAKLTQQYEQNKALRNAEFAIQESRQRRIDMYQLSVFNQDKTGAREAMRDIGEFNKRNPMWAITNDTLQQGSKTRLERSARSIGGVTLNKNLVYLYKDLLFTPNERLKPSDGKEETEE